MDWSLLALESLVMAIHHFKMKTKASLMVQWLSICLTMQEGFPGGASGQESACNAADVGSTPGSGRSLEKAMATQSSLLAWRIPMDRGAWWATVYRTAKSQTRLKQLGPLQLLGSIPGLGRPHMPWSN